MKMNGYLLIPAVLPPGERSRYPLDMRLGGPQSRSGRCREEENLTSAGIRTQAVQPITYTDWARWIHTSHTIYTVTQLKIVFILTVTWHVSAAVGHLFPVTAALPGLRPTWHNRAWDSNDGAFLMPTAYKGRHAKATRQVCISLRA
jgi:hypothetical protein